MILADWQIRQLVNEKRMTIHPLPEPDAYQPASLDIRIGHDVAIKPGQLVLGHTLEYIEVPANIAIQLSGKSSLGRLGLLIHVTAGWIDPGFKGQIVLELVNLSTWPIVLAEADYVGQLVFNRMSAEPRQLYGAPGRGSHYQNQQGTVPSYLERDRPKVTIADW